MVKRDAQRSRLSTTPNMATVPTLRCPCTDARLSPSAAGGACPIRRDLTAEPATVGPITGHDFGAASAGRPETSATLFSSRTNKCESPVALAAPPADLLAARIRSAEIQGSPSARRQTAGTAAATEWLARGWLIVRWPAEPPPRPVNEQWPKDGPPSTDKENLIV